MDGLALGDPDSKTGDWVDGALLGSSVVGTLVAMTLGRPDGWPDGATLGAPDDTELGSRDSATYG